MAFRRWVIVSSVAISAAWLAEVGRASAQEAPHRTVEITVAGEPTSATALEEVIRAMVGGMPVDVTWTSVPRIDPHDVLAARAAVATVLARVWVDFADSERAMIFIANDAHDRFLVRSVPMDEGYGEVVRESLAHILASAVDAMLSGGEIGVSREVAIRELGPEAAPPPPPPPPPAASPPPPADAEPMNSTIALLYGGELLSDDPLLRHGPGLGLSLTGFTGRDIDVLVWLELRYHAPLEYDGDGRGARFDGGGARLAVGAIGRLGDLVTWRALIGAGTDIAYVRPLIAADTGLVAVDPFLVIAPMLSVQVGGAVRLDPFELILGLGLEADLAGNHYDVGTVAVFSPWPLRPLAYLALGLAWDLL